MQGKRKINTNDQKVEISRKPYPTPNAISRQELDFNKVEGSETTPSRLRFQIFPTSKNTAPSNKDVISKRHYKLISNRVSPI